MFTVKTKISSFETFEAFAKAFELNAEDLVITQSFLYEPYMKPLNLPCTFVMQDKYGNGEPSDEMMNHILADVQGRTCRRIIGIGGGTVIDISKIFALKGVTNVTDAFERNIPIEKEKTLVIVPTTCGTGSEVTNISIAEIKSKHTKMGLADDAILADDAVLIPELLKGLPFKFYVFSSIDALIHAMESYLSPKADAYTRLFSTEAIHIIINVFRNIVDKGEDYRFQCLAEMLTASNFAGIAFGNAGVGAVHALSYPLGGTYHVAHGEANYQFFTHIFKLYTAKKTEGHIKDLNTIVAKELGLCQDWVSQCPQSIYDELSQLLNNLIKANPLRHYGMKETDVDAFTDNVLQTQQRLLKNNYVPLSKEEIRNIYQQLY